MDLPESAIDAFKKAVWRTIEENPEALTPHILSHANALRRIAGRGVECRTVFDVGASDGRWTSIARDVWPEARYHLIEAFQYWERDLAAFCKEDLRLSFTLAAAGEYDGTTAFFNSVEEPFGGSAMPSDGEPQWTVPQVAIDREAERLGLTGPFLIKLDTHGTEREILAGAEKTLEQTNVLVIEMYNFGNDARRFPAMCQHVESLGFHCIDIGEPMFRDRDRAFWQIDFFFIRKDRPEAQCGDFT